MAVSVAQGGFVFAPDALAFKFDADEARHQAAADVLYHRTGGIVEIFVAVLRDGLRLFGGIDSAMVNNRSGFDARPEAIRQLPQFAVH